MTLTKILEITERLHAFRSEINTEAAAHPDDLALLESLAVLDEQIAQATTRIELAGAAWNLKRRQGAG